MLLQLIIIHIPESPMAFYWPASLSLGFPFICLTDRFFFLITPFLLQMRNWEKSHWSPLNIFLASVFAFNKGFQPARSYKEENIKIWSSNHTSLQREPFNPGGSRRPLHCASALYALWIEDVFMLQCDIWVKIFAEVVTN